MNPMNKFGERSLKKDNLKESTGGETPTSKETKNFSEFLYVNPYAAGKKSSSITPDPKTQEAEKLNERNFLNEMKKAYEHFDINQLQESKDPKLSSVNEKADKMSMENSATFKKFATLDEVLGGDGIDSILMASANFFSPQSELEKSKLDPAQKKMVEAMQKRIVSLDQEAKRLKKINTEHETKVKKLSDQVATFTYEKENFAKIKDNYEKRVKKLEAHCTDNDEMFMAMKRILTLQEQELFSKFEKKINDKLKAQNTEVGPKSRHSPLLKDQQTPQRTSNTHPTFKFTVQQS